MSPSRARPDDGRGFPCGVVLSRTEQGRSALTWAETACRFPSTAMWATPVGHVPDLDMCCGSVGVGGGWGGGGHAESPASVWWTPAFLAIRSRSGRAARCWVATPRPWSGRRIDPVRLVRRLEERFSHRGFSGSPMVVAGWWSVISW